METHAYSLKFSRSDADIHALDGTAPETALARTTHLCVAAHQDDIEIMAQHGITECHGCAELHFTGVVVTNGAGSPRAGAFADLTDAAMMKIRREEQRRAAELGKYNLQVQLAHPSADVKLPGHPGLMRDLAQIFGHCRPRVVYLHNPADKHDTHVAVFLRCLAALRALPKAQRPPWVLGCEVWRDLDWLVDADKIGLDAGGDARLARELLEIFQSQVSGGKRYDEATLGRRAANATFHSSHRTDQAASLTWAMDLSPLVADENLPVIDYVLAYIDRLRADVKTRLERHM